MFILMNGARLFVGIQGLGLSEIAYQSALYYSKERLQGKSANTSSESDPIIAHPEIRKNLLYIKAVNEGIRGLMYYTGYKYDISKYSNFRYLENNHPNSNVKETSAKSKQKQN